VEKNSSNSNRSPDLTGKRFGRLIVLRRNGFQKKGDSTHQQQAMWLCKCDCGTEKTIRAASLKAGESLSCGCLRNERYLASRKQRQESAVPGEAACLHLMQSYKSGARRRGLGFTLSFEETRHLFQSACSYCGDPPSLIQKGRPGYGDFVYNGIDRIDSQQGYVPGNVVSSCQICNFAKGTKTDLEFRTYLRRVAAFHKGKDLFEV
jgi:hypothetical protein